VLGQMSIVDDYLIATVNSVERTEILKDYLKGVLGKLIGNPLSIHENFQSMMENYSTTDPLPSEPLDAPELITASLDQHYRKILDEPVPALNNLTPRECSQNVDQFNHLSSSCLYEISSNFSRKSESASEFPLDVSIVRTGPPYSCNSFFED
jgi:hypothetical protein